MPDLEHRIPNPLNGPYLIIGEGASDAAFFWHLNKTHGLAGFQTAHPKPDKTHTSGRQGFGDLLGAIYSNRGFRNLRAIIIASDNDQSPDDSFAEVRGQIRLAGGFGVPDRPLEPAIARGYPAIVVMMLPWIEEVGAMERLCIEAAYNKWQIKECLDDFARCASVDTWNPGKQDKMRMRCILSATCDQDPNSSLQYNWSKSERYQIPLTDPVFNRIVTFLREFDTWLTERI